jgi:PHP family Zn ribbon phosphoesterase
MTGICYDLHIHSCLSPCASDDMTPANIAGMASIKGLSLIALTDHNSGRNLKVMSEAAAEFGLSFIPGIEVTSTEEVHILTYFKNVEDAVCFGEFLYDALPDILNRPEIFGHQIVMGKDDQPMDELPKLLLQATPFSLDEISRLVREAGGCSVPAHINRTSFSVCSNLGFMPPGLFRAAEVSADLPCPTVDSSLYILHSSDAHSLGDISEPIHHLDFIHNSTDFVDFINKTDLK